MMLSSLLLVALLTCFNPDILPSCVEEQCVVCASLDCPPPPPCEDETPDSQVWTTYIPMVGGNLALANCAGVQVGLMACDTVPD